MFIADFHIHSKYSRATSRECVPERLELWARRKGLHLIGTGDFTHRAWRDELKEKLLPAEEGLYRLKDDFRAAEEGASAAFSPRFIISGEISSIYKQGGKVRKVHNLILLPSLEAAETLSRRLELIGNLHSDGRPILGLASRDLLEITLEACAEAIFIPAHIWTPHFSLFGAYSGFDDINECFADLTGHIHALETGLSSDPPMNWRLSALDGFTLVSNSDAHSPANLAREANIFTTELSYPHIARALNEREGEGFFGTIEFFPEEGKYHYDGHRNCRVCQKPADTIASAGICPVCGGRITVGVLHRVEALADRAEGFKPANARHFESLVPLPEVIASAAGFSAVSKKGRGIYDSLINNLGPELFILREAELAEIERQAGPLVAEGIRRLRLGQLTIRPGYDGEYGKVQIMDKNEREHMLGQLYFFSAEEGREPVLPAAKQKKPVLPAEAALDVEKGPAEHGLNQEQQEAVCSLSHATAVVAGPGTGKTRTLVARAAHLLQSCGVRPAHITAVTFTNKAAQEMRQRLEQELQNKRTVQSMIIGTFHAICLRLLSGNNGGAGINIIDEANALSLLRGILDERGLKNQPREVLREISLHKNGSRSKTDDSGLPEGVYEEYMQQLEAYQALDYDDLLLRVLEQMESGALGAEACASFSHLLVDEFQDINKLQYRLIQAWGKHSADIFVIGDPHQSIYSFRGSDAACFSWFLDDYPQAKQISLTRNYRSTPQIMSCAATLIAKNKGCDTGALPQAGRPGGCRVRLLTTDSAGAEALAVGREISRMVGGLDMLESGKTAAPGPLRGFSDIAVLYRTNRQAELLERRFQAEGIPYTVSGREDFLTAAEVLIALSFFRLLLNPADPFSRRRCLNEFGEWKFTELAEKYAPLAGKEKPAKLLEEWISDNGLDASRHMEMLLHVSVLHKDMPSFLQNLSLGRNEDVRRSGAKKPARDAVSLLTLHGAKGLEFPVVFLSGLTEGLLPFIGRGGSCNLEEERRLFYVGITRAGEELVLLSSGAPSPFLAELPREELMEESCAGKAAPAFEQFSLFDTH